mmetsp:Transcript_41689/g.126447  ORF Transcript_41689/g.126447 Transcript_41689/m.126447 type:complete len:222 (+) Transcript_41689:3646-4311(+)
MGLRPGLGPELRRPSLGGFVLGDHLDRGAAGHPAGVDGVVVLQSLSALVQGHDLPLVQASALPTVPVGLRVVVLQDQVTGGDQQCRLAGTGGAHVQYVVEVHFDSAMPSARGEGVSAEEGGRGGRVRRVGEGGDVEGTVHLVPHRMGEAMGVGGGDHGSRLLGLGLLFLHYLASFGAGLHAAFVLGASCSRLRCCSCAGSSFCSTHLLLDAVVVRLLGKAQ